MNRLRIRDTRGLEGATGSAAAHAALTTTAHGGIIADDDSRLTDARTPTAHAASHMTGADRLQVSATDKILGRSSAGAGNVEEIPCTAAARSILDDATVAAIRATLDLDTANSPTFNALTLSDLLSGTIYNKQKTYEMLGLILRACTDCRLLLGFNGAVVDGGTAVDYSTYLQTVTYVDAGDWSDTQRLKKGWVWSLNPTATNDYLLVSDAASLSFGDGASTDTAFTIFCWVEVVAGSDIQSILMKCSDYSAKTTAEWAFMLSDLEKLYMVLYDNDTDGGAGSRIGRVSSALSAGWHCLCATYDGSKAYTGIHLYVDGVLDDAASYNNGTYVAMHNTAQAVGVLAENDNGRRFLGDIGSGVCIDAAAWSAQLVKAMYTMTRGYYNL